MTLSKYTKRMIAGVAAVVTMTAAMLLPSCNSNGNAEGESTYERIQRTGVVRIGYANEAPYAFKDPDTGEVTGEAPEIAKYILKDMGIDEVEGVLTQFGSLIPGVKANRFDVIAAGMYIKPKRCEQVDFSNPTYKVGESFAVQAGNPLDLHSYEDVKDNPDVTLAVVNGAIEQRYAEEVGIPDDQVKRYPDHSTAFAAVKTGRVDAYGGTALTIQNLVDKDDSGDAERATPFQTPIIDGEPTYGYGAFAFRKGDAEMVEEFNKRLEEFIGSEEHLELVRQFGFTENELPGGVTAAELCEGE